MHDRLAEGRSTIIIGNGLGMAVDPKKFNLHNIVNEAMSHNDYKLENKKFKLIWSCIDHDSGWEQSQFTEDNLQTVVKFMGYCKEMAAIERDDIGWLSENGRNFSKYVREFNFNIAKYLAIEASGHIKNKISADMFRIFDAQCKGKDVSDIPIKRYLKKLCEFVRNTKSHVATLNYDTILYDAFIEDDILFGTRGSLIDGFLPEGFKPPILDRSKRPYLGYYLHLHGSPLYYDEGKTVCKLKRSQLDNTVFDDSGGREYGRHIVLTHSDEKMNNINSSQVLCEYWERLKEAIAESNSILLFGYSGLDKHLNDLIRITRGNKRLTVIEWDDPTVENEERIRFWEERLCQKDAELEYEALECILEIDL